MAEEALETVDGAAFARQIIDELEAELVRFRHRVAHDHAIELDRARAAMVMLGKLVSSGVPWTALPDSDPARIHEAFTQLVARDAKLAPILKREIAAFFAATADVEVKPDEAKTSAALLRRAGADPALWWWAAEHPEPAKCWLATGSEVGRVVQTALALGVSVDVIARGLATVLGMLLTRVKTRSATKREDLVAALACLAEGGAEALGEQELVAAITKTAFEMMWKKDPKTTDALAEFAVHTFQLLEALKAWKGVADLERWGALGVRIEQMQAARGMQIAALLRKEIEQHVERALAKL
jgi:hypothetical protein